MSEQDLSSCIKIMTLNVNGFRGLENKEPSHEISKGNMLKIKEIIDKELINKNDIVIMQEIPHVIMENGRLTKSVNPLFYDFNEIFKEYKILIPKHLKRSKQYTAAICKQKSLWGQLSKDILKYDAKYSYGNKFVELQCGKITLLGVHMPLDNKMWDLLIPSLKNAPYTYVLGDFNANEKRNIMSVRPEEIRNCGYNSLITSNMITCYSTKTSIDNIYLNSSVMLNKQVTIKVQDTNLTDHALCIFETEL